MVKSLSIVHFVMPCFQENSMGKIILQKTNMKYNSTTQDHCRDKSPLFMIGKSNLSVNFVNMQELENKGLRKNIGEVYETGLFKNLFCYCLLISS